MWCRALVPQGQAPSYSGLTSQAAWQHGLYTFGPTYLETELGSPGSHDMICELLNLKGEFTRVLCVT